MYAASGEPSSRGGHAGNKVLPMGMVIGMGRVGTPCSFVVVARMMERKGAGYDRRARYMRLGECQKIDEREDGMKAYA